MSSPVSLPEQPSSRDGVAVVESLARAARQVALYGPDHPMSLSASSQAIHLLEGETAQGVLALRVDGDRLLWNEAPLPDAHAQVAWLREAMHQRVMATIAFRAPVRAEEVVRLLTILAEDPRTLITSGGAMRVFAAQPSGSVHIGDFDLARELRESEVAWLDSCQRVEPEAAQPLSDVVQYCLRTRNWGRSLSSLTPPGNLPVGVDASYGEDRPPRELLAEALARLIQQAGESTEFADEEQRQAWRLEILRHLNSLGPEWRVHVFRSPSGASTGYPDMLTLIAREMSPEECVLLVLEYPGAIARERSSGLSLALSRIMSDPERVDAIAPLLHDAAMRGGISEQVYQNVVGVLMLELGESPGNLPVAGVPTAVAAASMGEPADADLSDLLQTLHPGNVWRSRMEMLMEIVEFDLGITQHAALLRLLAEAIQRSAAHGDSLSLREGLNTLRRLSESGEESWRAVATTTLAHVGTPSVVSALLAAVEETDGPAQAEATELLGVLGDPGMEALSTVVRRGDSAVAEQAARVMMQHGSPGFRHVQGLLSAASQETARLVVRAALSGGDRALLGQLQALIAHPDAGVRLEVVNMMREHGEEELVELLLRFVWDPDVEVRVAAINALAERRALAAVSALCALVRRGAAHREPVRAREAAILALGGIGAPAAVQTLAEVLGSAGLLDLFRGSSLRVGAAHALASIGTTEARELLEIGARDRHRSVREACRHALVTLAVAEGRSQKEPADVR